MKKTGWINFLYNLDQVFIEGMLMIFYVLFESPDSAHSFREYMSSKRHNINFTIEQQNIGSLSFLDVKIYCKNAKSIVFTEDQHLVGFSAIMKISLQRTTREGF